MNYKKAIFCAFLGTLGVAALSFSLTSARMTPTYATNGGIVPEQAVRYDDSSFQGESEIDPATLLVKATSSTKTSMGESFTFSFSTGGTGYQDATKTFTIAPTDSSFSTYYDEFLQMTSEEKEIIQEQYDNGEYETQIFGGQIYSLLYQASVPNIVVPQTFSRGIFFSFRIDEIAAEALTEAAVTSGVKSVTIPKTIATVYEDSFPHTLDSSFIFNVEYEESELPATWANGWAHGATVNYGYDYEGNATKTQKNAMMAGSTVEYGDKEANYIIGYYPSTGDQYPLVMSYRLTNSTETRYFEFEKSTTSSIGSAYDAVGHKLFGFSNSLFADIPIDLSSGESIDFNTVVIHNIFPAIQGSDSNWGPDLEHPYYSAPLQSYSKTLDVNDLISYKFNGVSTFGGYTAIDLIVDQTGNDTYAALKSSYFNQYKENIASGRMYIRYRITSLTSCAFQATYDANGEEVVKEVPIATPVNQHILRSEKGNFVSFLFKNSNVGKGFNAKSVRQLSFVSFYLTLDLFDNANGIVARSNYNARFGYLMVMPRTEKTNAFDINMMLIIMCSAYVAAYIAGAIVLFFYLKNKYKNDEFRRIKPKAYLLKAVLGLFGSLIVILCITFIIVRFTAFNNAIVVYNPVDAYIIVTVVASVLIIGYFIKYLVAVSKANKERKKIIKLKLNEDVDEDGVK